MTGLASSTILWRDGAHRDATSAMDHYCPHESTVPAQEWPRVRPIALECVAATRPTSAASAVQRLRITAQYLYWCQRSERGSDPRSIFTEDLIEVFFADVDFGLRSCATLRSQLRAVAKANSCSIWTPTPQLHPRVPNRAPYSADEVSRLLALIDVQSTARRRRILEVTLSVGLGLGLTAPEILALRKTDLTREHALVLANLPTRIVPVRARYAGLVWETAQTTPGARLLGDHLHPSRAYETLLREVEIPRYLPALKVRRLRTTWMVDVLSDGSLTIPEFWAISGIASGRVLDELAPHLPTRSGYLLRAAGA